MQTTLTIGNTVSDRYQVEALLGKGGFGAVYLVRDLRVKQNVFALKEVINPAQHEKRHFAFEVDLLKRVDHPSLPRVYRSFDNPSQNRTYMLMDYIEGLNLEQLRRKRPDKRLPLAEVFTLLGPIVEAISYLHAQQPPIIHRDIKPSNIIAPTSGDRPVLVDFGIAKEFAQDATTSAIRLASPGYGAPEQYSAGTNKQTDVYGLGATTYALLTGTVPTDAFTRITQYLGKNTDPLPPAREVVPELPAHVSDALNQALALESEARFSSVEDFWKALYPDTPAPAIQTRNNVIINEVRSADRDPAPLPDRAPTRGRWLIIALLLLFALGLGFLSALLVFPGLRGQQTHSPATATRQISTPTPAKPTPTFTSVAKTPVPTPSPTPAFPSLVANYNGTLHDNNGNITASMSLSNLTQQQAHIQGYFTVGSPLSGNGSFTGTVTPNATIQFIVHSADSNARAPLSFSGSLSKNGNLSGSYCSLNSAGNCDPQAGGYGTWFVQPVNTGS